MPVSANKPEVIVPPSDKKEIVERQERISPSDLSTTDNKDGVSILIFSILQI